MARYRFLEINDKLINDGKPYWRIEKKIWDLWWSEYFDVHHEDGCNFYDYAVAVKWYQYYTNPKDRVHVEVLHIHNN